MNLVEMAEKRLKAFEFEKAKQLYEEALQQDNRNAFLYQQLARCLWKLGQHQESEEKAHKALQLDSSLVLPHVTLAYLYSNQRKEKEALEEAQKALRKNSKLKEAYYFLGWHHLNANDSNKAREFFQKVIEIDPLSPDGYMGVGAAFAKERNLKETRYNCKKAAQLGDKHAALLVTLTYFQQARIFLVTAAVICFLAMLFVPSTLISTLFFLAGFLFQIIPVFFMLGEKVRSPSTIRRFLFVIGIFLVGYILSRIFWLFS